MKKVNTFELARDIMRSLWFVSEPEKLMRIARDFLAKSPIMMDAASPEMKEYSCAQMSSSGEKKSNRKKIMIVPLHGTMTKYDTCASYGTQTLAEAIEGYADDSSIAGVVLDIDSGGGSGNAVPPLVAAIKKLQAAGKPICVHCDLCGSAAYWVASQCDAIYMDNKTSEVGSIGAYYLFCDDSAQNPTTGEKWISIYAQESEDKNYAYRQALEGNIKPAQEELAVYVKMFQDDVMAGRPGILKDEKGVLTGKMFITSEAIRLGMADGSKSLKETAEIVMALAGL
ncbi:MAG: S49 family peptidase [Bacteroides sp.]|nr:S49 family peptidase [Bacteroides sp.]